MHRGDHAAITSGSGTPPFPPSEAGRQPSAYLAALWSPSNQPTETGAVELHEEETRTADADAAGLISPIWPRSIGQGRGRTGPVTSGPPGNYRRPDPTRSDGARLAYATPLGYLRRRGQEDR
ncbi:hypothetical protein GCM10017691_19630 [Pseudonocardia petroleophila]